jgi:hypothetical protein
MLDPRLEHSVAVLCSFLNGTPRQKLIKHQYTMLDDGDWTAIDITGYPFKDFYHFAEQLNWLTDNYGEPTYTQRNMRVYGEREAFVSIIHDDEDFNEIGDPIYRFGFLNKADAVAFYIAFV